MFWKRQEGAPRWRQQSKAQRQVKARAYWGAQQVRAEPRTLGDVAQKSGCF